MRARAFLLFVSLREMCPNTELFLVRIWTHFTQCGVFKSSCSELVHRKASALELNFDEFAICLFLYNSLGLFLYKEITCLILCLSHRCLVFEQVNESYVMRLGL